MRNRSQVALLIVGLLVGASLGTWWHARSLPPPILTEDAVFAEFVSRVDTDHDGRISVAEWKAFGGKPNVFAAYDFNGDGYLDVREVKAMFYSLDPKPGL